jgi:hypothetical protein
MIMMQSIETFSIQALGISSLQKETSRPHIVKSFTVVRSVGQRARQNAGWQSKLASRNPKPMEQSFVPKTPHNGLLLKPIKSSAIKATIRWLQSSQS